MFGNSSEKDFIISNSRNVVKYVTALQIGLVNVSRNYRLLKCEVSVNVKKGTL